MSLGLILHNRPFAFSFLLVVLSTRLMRPFRVRTPPPAQHRIQIVVHQPKLLLEVFVQQVVVFAEGEELRHGVAGGEWCGQGRKK